MATPPPRMTPMILEASGISYKTANPCEWATPVSKQTGFMLHVLEHAEYATIEMSDRTGEHGGYVDMDADEIAAVARILSGVAARLRAHVRSPHSP